MLLDSSASPTISNNHLILIRFTINIYIYKKKLTGLYYNEILSTNVRDSG